MRVELYLRDRVIWGELSVERGRPLDLFNRRGQTIDLSRALSASLHVTSEPRWLGSVRIAKEHLLLVVPHDAEGTTAAPRRRAWEWKKPLEVEAGLGPLVAVGTVHIGKWDDATLANAQRSTDGREFVPMTRATISATQHPGWAVKQPVLFLRARAITYLGLVQGASDRLNGALDGDAHDLNGTRLIRA